MLVVHFGSLVCTFMEGVKPLSKHETQMNHPCASPTCTPPPSPQCVPPWDVPICTPSPPSVCPHHMGRTWESFWYVLSSRSTSRSGSSRLVSAGYSVGADVKMREREKDGGEPPGVLNSVVKLMWQVLRYRVPATLQPRSLHGANAMT